MQTTPPLLAPSAPDWGRRNWKWFVPLLFLIAMVWIGGMVALFFGFMKSNDAYSGAVARARSNQAVMAALGTPIKEGFWVTGTVNVSGPTGRADLAIPVAGPKGKATIYVSATKSLGKWHFDGLIVQIDKTNERIDLSER